MISAEIKELIAAFPLGFVASVMDTGRPAVAPKGTFLVVDDATLGFADIRSPGTLKNLASTPYVEVNFIDILKRTGARLRGPARVEKRGAPGFDALFPRWAETWPDLAHRIRALLLVEVEAASTYRTPPYDDGATEDEMVALYKSKFANMYS